MQSLAFVYFTDNLHVCKGNKLQEEIYFMSKKAHLVPLRCSLSLERGTSKDLQPPGALAPVATWIARPTPLGR